MPSATVTSTRRACRASSIVRIVHRDAPRHPSPNGGVIEAAFAAALGVRLGGVNRYAGRPDDRGRIGDGPAPDLDSARRALRLAERLGALAAAAAALAGLVIRRAYLRGDGRVRHQE